MNLMVQGEGEQRKVKDASQASSLAMFHLGEVRSKARLKSRCFWLGSWIPKPAVAFSP